MESGRNIIMKLSSQFVCVVGRIGNCQ